MAYFAVLASREARSGQRAGARRRCQRQGDKHRDHPEATYEAGNRSTHERILLATGRMGRVSPLRQPWSSSSKNVSDRILEGRWGAAPCTAERIPFDSLRTSLVGARNVGLLKSAREEPWTYTPRSCAGEGFFPSDSRDFLFPGDAASRVSWSDRPWRS